MPVWKGTCKAVNHHKCAFAETTALQLPDFVLAGTREKEKESTEMCVDLTVMSFLRLRHQNQLELCQPLNATGEKVRRVLMWEKEISLWISVCASSAGVKVEYVSD